MVLKNLKIDTPLEQYKINGRIIWVKRDDLMGDNNLLPPWGKIEAIYHLVSKYVDRSKPLTHLVVNGSWSGWALAAICDELGIEFYYSYPDNKKISQELIQKVKTLYPNTKFNAVQNNIQDIMYAQLAKDAKQKEWQLLPYAFNHKFYIEYLEKRMSEVLKEKSDFRHLVVSSGEGVTSAGLIKEFLGGVDDFFNRGNKKVWTTCVSSVGTIERTYKQYDVLDKNRIQIRKSEFDFNNRLDTFEAPFPCNQFWDIKQWKWLVENIDRLDGDILFWNIGGVWTY